jgi:hypothetical protein
VTPWRTRFPGRGLVTFLVAIVGSALATFGIVELSFLRFGVYTMPGLCMGGPCVTAGPHYYPYIPTFLIAVVLVTAVAPLIAAFVPRFRWAGVLCALVGVGVPGALWLSSAVFAPYPVQSFLVVGLSGLLVVGAALIVVGLALLKPPSVPEPPRVPVHVLSNYAAHSNGIA